ncbi:MAG: hypothetical protein IJM71_05655 [Clostridia bacterium]|nr:hypothetical protein [Clostridia bacterium]
MKTVFLIGDSIRDGSRNSPGYGDIVARRLEGEMNIVQPDGNCEFTTYTLRHIRDWVRNQKIDRADVIHWNNGLWDCAYIEGDPEPLVPPEEYARNLTRIVRMLRHFFPEAKIIFALTTPIIEEAYTPPFMRRNATIREYNRIAVETLAPLGVSFNDLYAVAEAMTADDYADRKTHFNAAADEILADAVVAAIRREIKG